MSNLFSIEGKVALVTGGSRGIGLMIARAYVENGVKVYISSRKAEVCDAVAAELSQSGTCISLPADLSTDEGRKSLVASLKEKEDSLDILVNNAGAVWAAPFKDFPDNGYDKTMDINVRAVFLLTRDLLPLLEKNASTINPARIINIGSIDGLRVPEVDNFPYAASKAAVHQLTRVLAVKLGRKGITVNAIAPGPFESKMTEWMLDNFKAQIEAQCPLKRIGSPEDMAGMAIYLASPAGAYVNGTIIPLDGGIHIS
ncbi:MAG: SDR family oxidoreductase [Bacteroidia bacterium]